jgi:Na+/H+ antiporter NhaD/arsenite permease-like protein
VSPHKLYAGIDGGLLLMFAGLFIVVAGAEMVLFDDKISRRRSTGFISKMLGFWLA